MDQMTIMRELAMNAITEAGVTGGPESERIEAANVKEDFRTLTSYKTEPQASQRVAPHHKGQVSVTGLAPSPQVQI